MSGPASSETGMQTTPGDDGLEAKGDLPLETTMPEGSHPPFDRSAVECSAAFAATAMLAAADSLQARLELVLDERLGPLSADQRGFLQVARKDGQRLLKLIADFREIALAEAGLLELEWDRVELGEAARAAAAAVADQAESLDKTIEVRCEQPAPIAADSGRVHDALVRLARYAVRQSTPGSLIAFRVEGGGLTLVYEAEAPPGSDSLAVAFASAIAAAHGGGLTVSWTEPRVEIAVVLEPGKGSVSRIGVAA